MSTREDDRNGWQLFTFGDFRLLDDAGQNVKLANRKVEALLAALAVHRQYGVERDSLAEILWPNRPHESQRANLRQTLSLLKRVLGEDALETSRSHLRLSSSLLLQCDYKDDGPRPNAVFMPGHEGEWFDDIRSEGPSQPERSVVGNFRETVEMLAMVDPRGMFDQLRANPSMTRGIPYSQLKALLGRFDHLEFSRGWAEFWNGTITDDLEQSATLLRSAMREAKRAQDYELASEVSLELGRAYCRTGNLEKAEKMCNIAETLAGLMKTRSARANADRLRGTYMINWSDSKQGLLLIQKTEDLTDDVVGRTHLNAVRSFFSASIGDYRQAEELLIPTAKTAPILGHSPTLLLIGLSRALPTISGGNATHAVPELERISRESRNLEITQTAVYAEELLERIYDRSGDRTLSQSRLMSAQQGRKQSQMVVTPVEAKRLTYVS